MKKTTLIGFLRSVVDGEKQANLDKIYTFAPFDETIVMSRMVVGTICLKRAIRSAQKKKGRWLQKWAGGMFHSFLVCLLGENRTSLIERYRRSPRSPRSYSWTEMDAREIIEGVL